MSKFFGENEQIIRFLLLTCGLLTLAGAVACLLLGNALLAVASCIVSAWTIGYYLDTVWVKMAAAQRGRSEPEQQHDATQE